MGYGFYFGGMISLLRSLRTTEQVRIVRNLEPHSRPLAFVGIAEHIPEIIIQGKMLSRNGVS